MTERPILFSADMVNAILAGKKAQTRRVINPQPQPYDGEGVPSRFYTGWEWPCAKTKSMIDMRDAPSLGPFGGVDRLWVRETWRLGESSGDIAGASREDSVHYRADQDECAGGPWKPSIFMPRWASRITLKVTGVRVERLQGISEEDAKAEGVDAGAHTMETARQRFQALWNRINGKRPGCDWASNPWVWVVEFEREQADD